MHDALAQLEPRLVWEYFAKLASIPRPSKHETKVCDWIRELSRERGFESKSDRTGNIVVRVPASHGLENGSVVILQSHVDMVCEKNQDTVHDFMTDPIRPRVDGDWVYGSGTTLGADNGIGVAAALAVATDPTIQHGPLELLFTVDEETGLTGAAGLDATLLKGRTLLNLDTEEDGVLCVGCAGGADSIIEIPAAAQPPTPAWRAYRVAIRGLRGGHSGAEIHENRGNAIKLLTRILVAGLDAGVAMELIELSGGNMHNAIPREAEAAFFLADGGADKMKSVIGRLVKDFRDELRGIDDQLNVEFHPTQHQGQAIERSDRNRLLHLLMALPHGVLGMSRDIPGLVETSSCVAVVKPIEGAIRIVASSRSSQSSRLNGLLGSIRSIVALAGGEIETRDGYPGWKPNMQSRALSLTRQVYAQIWSREPEVTAVHAGLECGLIGQKLRGLDMLSLGPQIEAAHSPQERVQISSVARFYQALGETLRVLA